MSVIYRAAVADGWWPQFSPDGRYLAFGNAVISVYDLHTARLVTVGTGTHPQWMSATELTFWTPSLRFLADESTGWRVRPAPEAPSLSIGNTVVARDGHWASWLSGPDRIVYDGQIVATGTGGAIAVDGAALAYTSPDGKMISVHHGPSFRPQHGAPHQVQFRHGCISYGYFGRVGLIDVAAGTDTDVTVTPWKGEGPAIVFLVGGERWLATPTEVPGTKTGLVLLRPLGDPRVISVPLSAVALDVAVRGRTILVAACGDRGQLEVHDANADAPRAILTAPAPPPVTIPPPSSIQPLQRPVLWFTYKEANGIGNAVIWENQTPAELRAIVAAGKQIIGIADAVPQLTPFWSSVAALYVHVENDLPELEVEAARAIAAMKGLPRRPILSYTGPTVQPTARGVDIHGIEGYLPADTPDPVNTLRNHVKAAASAFGSYQLLFLHCQSFDRRKVTGTPQNSSEGWTDIAGLTAMQAVYPELVAADSRFVGGGWFCGSGRAGGTGDYPQFAAYHVRTVAVTPGAPPIVQPPPPPVPPGPVPPLPIPVPPVQPPEDPMIFPHVIPRNVVGHSLDQFLALHPVLWPDKPAPKYLDNEAVAFWVDEWLTPVLKKVNTTGVGAPDDWTSIATEAQGYLQQKYRQAYGLPLNPDLPDPQ